jgi:hypothetical protein
VPTVSLRPITMPSGITDPSRSANDASTSPPSGSLKTPTGTVSPSSVLVTGTSPIPPGVGWSV